MTNDGGDLVERARSAMHAGDAEAALRLLERAHGANPQDLRLLYRVGADADFAPLRAETAFALFDAFRLSAEALELQRAGRRAEAVERHLEAIDRSSECLPSFVALERLASDDSELARFTELRLERRRVESVEDLGYWFLRVAGAPDEARPGHPAERIVERLLAEHPGESVAHFAAAQWRARLGDEDGVVASLTRVMELLPDVDGEWLREELEDFEEFDAFADSPALARLMRAFDEDRG